MDVRTFVNKHFRDYKESGDNYVVLCPMCHGGERGKKTMSINKNTGVFICNRKNTCNEKGSFSKIKEYMGEKNEYKKPEKLSVEKREYKPIKKDISKGTEKPITFFIDRKIAKETYEFFKVTIDKYYGKPSLCFPYYYKGELANIKYRMPKKVFAQEKNNYSTLWNIDNVKGKSIIITEGEIDCMTIWQCGMKNVTSMPSGANNHQWIDNNWEELEKFSTIYLAFDNDKAGLKALKDVSTRLGMHRCKEVRFPHKDANETYMDGASEEDIENIIKSAKDITPEKISLPNSFERDMIYEFNDPDYLKGTPSVFRKLTDNGFSGYRKGEVTIWTGYAGDGKSTVVLYEMVNQIVMNKKPCCIASLEMKPSRWLKTMVLQILGNNYRGYNDTVISGTLNYLKHKLSIVNYVGRITPEELFECFEYSAKRYGTVNFVVDNLMKIDLDLRDGYGGHKKFINDLSKFANKYGVHIHLVAHQKKPDSRFKYPEPSGYGVLGSSELFNGADNVITVYRVPDGQKEEENTDWDSHINVCKQRAYSERPKIGLVYCAGSMSFKGELHDELPPFLKTISQEIL